MNLLPLSTQRAYWKMDRFLNGKIRRVVRGKKATFVRRMGDDAIAVVYHHTHVVTAFLDGRILLNTGGWKTAITKRRMNEWLEPTPYKVYQKNRQWYVWNTATNKRLPFEGCTFWIYHG